MARYTSIHTGSQIDTAITEVRRVGNNVVARLSSVGAPTGETIGAVGDLYTDTAGSKLYRCTAASGGVYTWKEVDVDVDDTLTLSGAAADAKITGDRISLLESLVFEELSWEIVQRVVRAGKGATYFPVGYEFLVADSDTEQTLAWRVVAHDPEGYTTEDMPHCMLVELKTVYSGANGSQVGLQFDAPEALYYAAEGLTAGTYHFTWNYATGSMVSGTYQFTLTQPVSAGGQIVLGTNSSTTAITSCKVATYANVGDATPIESNITVSAGSSGLDLGTISVTSSTSANLNCAQRIMWGSNNSAQSALLQWLNSDATAGFWQPTNRFDRPPEWNAAQNGFMHGLPDDFLTAVQSASVIYRTNSAFEVESLDGTQYPLASTYTKSDRFFVLSRPEIIGTYDDSAVRDGKLLEYYDGSTAAERIKYDAAGNASFYWLRSPSSSSVFYVRGMYLDGNLNYTYATYARGVAPACMIG